MKQQESRECHLELYGGYVFVRAQKKLLVGINTVGRTGPL